MPLYRWNLTGATTIITAVTTEDTVAGMVPTIGAITGAIIEAGPDTGDRRGGLRLDAAPRATGFGSAVHKNPLSQSLGLEGHGLSSGAVH